MHRAVMPLLILAATSFAGCNSNGSDSSASSAPDPTVTAEEDAILDNSLRCDPLDERSCLLPWPNDAFTVPDADTTTGRRLDIHPESTPINVDGVSIDVTLVNRADGFSARSTILTVVPGLDLKASGISGVDDIDMSLAEDSPIVLLDTTAGTRLSYWAELDVAGTAGDQLLVIHPAEALPNGHRIVVALRNLKAADASIIVPTTAFEAAVEGTPEPSERARAFRELFAQLADDGVDTDGLFLAWDFTVASSNDGQQSQGADDSTYSDPVDRALARALRGDL